MEERDADADSLGRVLLLLAEITASDLKRQLIGHSHLSHALQSLHIGHHYVGPEHMLLSSVFLFVLPLVSAAVGKTPRCLFSGDETAINDALLRGEQERRRSG